MVVKKTKNPTDRSNVLLPPKKSRRKSRLELERHNLKLTNEQEILKSETEKLTTQANELRNEVERLNNENQMLQETLKYENCLFQNKLKGMSHVLNKQRFTYKCLQRNCKEFCDLCGFTIKEFDCIFDCLQPFTHLLIYPDCTQKDKMKYFNNKCLDMKTELLTALTNIDCKIIICFLLCSNWFLSFVSELFLLWQPLLKPSPKWL